VHRARLLRQRKVMTAARSPGATHFFNWSASGIAARFGGVSMMLGSTS
jgi:hypothetical protein